jgi:uncharacterized membrane protein YgcG
MARKKQLPHFRHHIQEARLTQKRFKIAILFMFIGLFVAAGLQFYGTHADSTSYYTVESKYPDFCLAANGSSSGAPVILATCQNAANQQWDLQGSGQVNFIIYNLCMAPLNDSTAQNAKVVLASCSQEDVVWEQDSAGHLIDSSLNSLCLTATSETGGLQLVMQTCVSGSHSSQTWYEYFESVTPAPTATPAPTSPPVSTPTPAPKSTPVPTAKPTSNPTSTPTSTPQGSSGGGGGGGSGGGGGGSGGSGGSSGGGGGSGNGNGSGSGGSSNGSGTGSSSSSGGGSGSSSSGSDSGASAVAPTVPAEFAATAESGNAVIDLSWLASTDDAGIADYNLQRSLDQVNWSEVSSSITSTSYDDTSVDFGIHYYYRLDAVDASGNTSPYAFADTTTASFTQNVGSGGTSSSYTSDDGIASVTVPSGGVSSDADCSVALGSVPASSYSGRKLVAGPYSLVCKDQQGTLISAFSDPISWSFKLKGKLKGLSDPLAYSSDSTGKLSDISNAKFNSSLALMTFTTSNDNSVLALASVNPGIPWGLLATIVLLLAIIVAVLIFILRNKQKVNYYEYIRSKYYNL